MSEKIVSRFVAHGIPGICSIAQSSKYLFMVDGTGFLVYPWVDAKALDQHAVSEPHALKIAEILAKMHCLNLDEPEITQPEFYTHMLSAEGISSGIRAAQWQPPPHRTRRANFQHRALQF